MLSPFKIFTRTLSAVSRKISTFDLRKPREALLDGFASAAAASIYCSPYYPQPRDHAWLELGACDQDNRKPVEPQSPNVIYLLQRRRTKASRSH